MVDKYSDKVIKRQLHSIQNSHFETHTMRHVNIHDQQQKMMQLDYTIPLNIPNSHTNTSDS